MEDLNSNALSIHVSITPKSPIEQSEEQVKLLEGQVLVLNNQLRDEQARSNIVKDQASSLEVIKKCNEARLADLLSGSQEILWEADDEGLHLLTSYSRCLDMKSIASYSETNTLKPGTFDFMEIISKQCKLEDPEKKEERLDKLKTAIINYVSYNRTRRTSARERSNSVKRNREEESDNLGISRPRLGSQTSISSAVSASALEADESSSPTS